MEALYPALYDTLRAHGHRLGLHLVSDGRRGHRRVWLSGAGFGALGHSIEHAARLYVRAGSSLAADADLRSDLRRLDASPARP
jgi:hypothetical protein